MGNVHICTRRLGRAARGIMSRAGIVNSRNTKRRRAYKVGERSSRDQVCAEGHGKQPSAKGLLHASPQTDVRIPKLNKGSSGTAQRTNRLI